MAPDRSCRGIVRGSEHVAERRRSALSAGRISRRVTRVAVPSVDRERFIVRPGTDAASDSVLAGKSASDFRMSFGFIVLLCCCCVVFEEQGQPPRRALRLLLSRCNRFVVRLVICSRSCAIALANAARSV